MAKQIYVSNEGYAKLQSELEYLKTINRKGALIWQETEKTPSWFR